MSSIFEVFKLEHIKDELRERTKNIEIDKIVLSSVSNEVVILCHHSSFIHPYYIDQLSMYISNAYFAESGRKSVLDIHYECELPDTTAELWKKYGEFVTYRLINKEQLYSYAFELAEIRFANDTMVLDLSDDFISNKVSRYISDDIRS